MSKTAIVKSGEHYFIKQLSNSQPIKLDLVIFANINGINSETDIDLNGSTPTADQIMYTAPVTQAGLLNDKTVVYSVILDTNVGDFTFNYIGLVNAETNTLCMVMHTNLTKKIKTAGQRQGNTITESIWLEIDNASESTGITVNAETWQINYSKRLAGEDERIRLTNYDLYNRLAIKWGLDISKLHNQLTVTPGVAYVAGLRVDINTNKTVTVEHNQSLYIDACIAGTVTGEWVTYYNLIAGTNLRDYNDGNFQHYVERIASVDQNGNLTVIKPMTIAKEALKKATAAVCRAGDNMTGDLYINNEPVLKRRSYGVGISKALDTGSIDDAKNFYSGFLFSQRQTQGSKPFKYCHVIRSFIGDSLGDIAIDILSKRAAFRGVITDRNNAEYVDDYSWTEFITTANLNSYLYSYLPVGIPLPWPQSTPPANWFECNGSPFNKNSCPKLAYAYPSGFLPDLRGEFIRGWDAGRGVDPGRGILSPQGDAMRNIWGEVMTAADPTYSSGAFYTKSHSKARINSSMVGGNQTIIFDASRVTPTSHDNHPRNIAFMYIVKAE